MQEEVIVNIGRDNYTTNITFGKHNIIADEPEDIGGKDQGMSPFPLLLSSLGTCMVMTMRMYANRKNWDLEAAEVKLFYEIQKSGLQQTMYIRCHITLQGNLDEDQKKRIYAISDKCPIKKTLSNPIIVESNLIDI